MKLAASRVGAIGVCAVQKSLFVEIVRLLIVLVFSRVFGSHLLWRELMGGDYDWAYKAIIQEALELSGYILIAYGSWLAYREK